MTTQLAVCSYGEYRPEMGMAVRTSRGIPRFFRYGELPAMEAVTPDGYMLRLPYEVFRKKYRAKLDDAGVDTIQASFDALARMRSEMTGAPPQQLVLLCYEKLNVPDKWCHRSVFAEWWEERTGQEVVELGATCEPHLF